MSEKDLGLKLATRRLYWSMGLSTRLNVKLSTHVSSAKRSPQKTLEYTDLDVLGIAQAPEGQSYTIIGDCKTSKKSVHERCFWLRGVSDFFLANAAELVRVHEVPVSARQLAERLDLGVMTEQDLISKQQWYEFDPEQPLEVLFSPAAIKRQQDAWSGLDSKLDRIANYRDLGYWIVEPHRRLDGVIDQLRRVDLLDHRSPSHRALFLDFVWLFCVSLIHATASIRATHASDVPEGLSNYMFGGAGGLRDKKAQLDLLKQLVEPDNADEDLFSYLPDYYPGLLELVTRYLRRPSALTESLRQAEWLTLAQTERPLVGMPAAEAFGDLYDEIAGKLLGDTIRFLCSASDLGEGFSDLNTLTEMRTRPATSDPTAERTRSGDDPPNDAAQGVLVEMPDQ